MYPHTSAVVAAPAFPSIEAVLERTRRDGDRLDAVIEIQTPWQAIGAMSYLRDRDRQLSRRADAVVLVKPTANGNHVVDPAWIDRARPGTRVTLVRGADARAAPVPVTHRIRRMLAAARPGLAGPGAGTLDVVSATTPAAWRIPWVLPLARKDQTLRFVLLDDGLSTFLERRQLRRYEQRKRNREGNRLAWSVGAKARIVRALTRRIPVVHRFAWRLDDDGRLLAEPDVVMDHRAVLEATGTDSGPPAGVAGSVLFLSQPFREAVDASEEIEDALLADLAAAAAAAGLEFVIKLHPRDDPASRQIEADRIGARILAGDIGLEALAVQAPPRLVVSHFSTGSVTVATLAGVPAASTGPYFLRDPDADPVLVASVDAYVAWTKGLVDAPRGDESPRSFFDRLLQS